MEEAPARHTNKLGDLVLKSARRKGEGLLMIGTQRKVTTVSKTKGEKYFYNLSTTA